MHPYLDKNWKPSKELDQESLDRIENLSNLKAGAHIHVSGACGTGTASVLQLLKDLGFRVTASDKAFYPPMGEVVKKLADKVYEGYSAENLKQRPELVVIGNSLSKSNPEVEYVLKENIPFCSMPEIFAGLLIGKRDFCQTSIVVTGTHGKTTTSAAVATLLDVAGIKPAYFIGGMPKNLKSSICKVDTSIAIENRTVVLEGDEYDSCFYAKYPKFHSYRPDIVIITSIEFDHGDIYNSVEEIELEFTKLLKRVPKSGSILICEEGGSLKKLIPQWKNDKEILARIYIYGEDKAADFKLIGRTNFQDKQKLELQLLNSKLQAKTELTGKHNALNLLVAAAVCKILNIEESKIIKGIETFQGVLRRQNLISNNNKIIIEDFAHHPSAVKVTLDGLKERYSNKRLIAIYEPRSNTSRRSFFQNDYIDSFKVADIVIMLEVQNKNVYSNTTEQTEVLDVEKLLKEISSKNGNVSVYCKTIDEIINYLKQNSRENDLIVLMSNGDFGGLAQRLPNEII